MKRSALQNKRVAVLRKALWARKDFGTFEKRAPGLGCEMLGDISSYRATLQSEGKQSIHSLTSLYVILHQARKSKTCKIVLGDKEILPLGMR